MKKTSSAVAAGILACSLIVPALNAQADYSPYPETSGQGFYCETGVRNPDPVPYGNLGVQRALNQNNPLSDKFRSGLNHFSMVSSAAILKDGQENKIFSPVSLYYALSLASLGAGGDTKEQLLTLLQAPDRDPWQLAEGCGNMYRLMFREDEYTRTRLSNSLWLQNGQSIYDNYRRIAESQYYTSVYRVDFSDENTPNIIENWASVQTGRPLSSTPRSYPEELMRSVNTVFYSSQWTYGFEESEGTGGDFCLADGRQTNCFYMCKKQKSSYYQGQGFRRASLPLKDNGSMIFILPEEGTDIPSLLSSEETMNEMFGYVPESYGNVSWKIPKFRFSTSMELKSPLQSMELSTAFQTEQADFSGINGTSYSIGNIIQESVVSVDEKGVNASEYTDFSLASKTPEQEIALEMNLDRPFLYAIVVTPGVPLFIGVCYDPGTVETDVTKPDGTPPGSLQTDSSEPDFSTPDAAAPGTSRPDSLGPGAFL